MHACNVHKYNTRTTSTQLKEELIQRAEDVNRGLDETPEQRDAIISLVEQLEKRNPTKRCVFAWAMYVKKWRASVSGLSRVVSAAADTTCHIALS